MNKDQVKGRIEEVKGEVTGKIAFNRISWNLCRPEKSAICYVIDFAGQQTSTTG